MVSEVLEILVCGRNLFRNLGKAGVWEIYFESKKRTHPRHAACVADVLDRLGRLHLQPVVDGRVATLSGTAPTEALKRRAKEIARTAVGRGGPLFGGITKVIDEMEVEPAPDPYQIRIVKVGPKLDVTGYLPGLDARDRFYDELDRLGYARDTINSTIDLRDGVPDGDWVGALIMGASQLSLLLDGELSLTDQRLQLEGQAPDPKTRIDVTLRMARPPSGYTADLQLIGTAIWSAQFTGDALYFTGSMPDAVDRTSLISEAESLFAGDVINDMGVIPMPDDDWVEAVSRILPGFLEFQTGFLTYKGDTLTISGDVTASVDDFLREDLVLVGTLVDFSQDTQVVPLKLDAFENAPDTGELPDAETCQAGLTEALSRGPINFEYATDVLSRDTGPVLDGLLTVFNTCPHLIFSVDAATHADGRRIALQNLTEDRQTAFSSYFIAHGVPIDQVELTDVSTDPEGISGLGELDPDRQLTVRLREYDDD